LAALTHTAGMYGALVSRRRETVVLAPSGPDNRGDRSAKMSCGSSGGVMAFSGRPPSMDKLWAQRRVEFEWARRMRRFLPSECDTHHWYPIGGATASSSTNEPPRWNGILGRSTEGPNCTVFKHAVTCRFSPEPHLRSSSVVGNPLGLGLDEEAWGQGREALALQPRHVRTVKPSHGSHHRSQFFAF